MLKIVDCAKRCEMEWYEVLRYAISDEAPSPVIIPTQGEIDVLKAGENEEIIGFLGAEPINLAFEQCELNPAFMARIIHANFPIVFRSDIFLFPLSGDEIANNVFEFENIPLKPKALEQYEGIEGILFSFSYLTADCVF